MTASLYLCRAPSTLTDFSFTSWSVQTTTNDGKTPSRPMTACGGDCGNEHTSHTSPSVGPVALLHVHGHDQHTARGRVSLTFNASSSSANSFDTFLPVF